MPKLLIAALSLLLWVVSSTLGQERRPPNYSQDSMPVTSFSCSDKIIGGYYADPETDCQMFHVCVKVPGQGIQDYKFLCPNDTAFNQENQICDDWFNIDCEASTLYYSDNFDLYRIARGKSALFRQSLRDGLTSERTSPTRTPILKSSIPSGLAGSDYPRQNQEPRLPSNNINNAVSESDDDFYLQRSDRGENVGSDLLRGSHSSNFFANKNRGREDEDEVKEDFRSKTSNKNGVRKLLTGKRPIATTAAPAVSYSTAAQYQPRAHNNYNSGRISQFRGHQRNQQPSSVSTEAPTRQTESYNRQSFQPRNYYSPTTPKIETTPSTQKNEFFRNYNPTTKRNYYENTQNFNAQTTTLVPQTTRNFQNARITTTTQPTTAFYETTATTNNERNNYYETQKLYKINTAAFNQYDDSKDEFFKTAQSQNLGASAFNSLQNSLKIFNTSVSSSYSFNPTVKPTTINYQTQTYFTPTTQPPNSYTQSTVFQQQNYYTTPKVQPSQQAYQQNFYNPSAQPSTTLKPVPQYTPTTLRPYQQTYTQPTETPFQQYNPTTQRAFQQQYNQQTNNPFQQQYNSPVPQQNYQQKSSPQSQLTTNYQYQRNTGSPQTYQTQAPKQYQQPQRNPSQFQQTSTFYNPTTQRSYQPVQTTIISRGKGTTLDTTEKPRPFTPEVKKEEKKEKDQYDYAYYDDGTQSEYDSIEPLEEFKRTRSKN